MKKTISYQSEEYFCSECGAEVSRCDKCYNLIEDEEIYCDGTAHYCEDCAEQIMEEKE